MDEELIEQLLNRQESGLDELQARYGGMLHYIADGILRDARDTEECVSDICLRVWDRIGQYDPQKGSFSAWLTALARNAALNFRRARAPAGEDLTGQEPSGETPEEALLRQEQADRLALALRRLSEPDQTLFYRKYYYCQSTAQMAAELGLTERAVEGKLDRLRKQLRRALGGARP